MKQISCDVAKDLMELYAGDVASDDSKNLLENHLAGCPECRKYFDRLKQELDMPVDEALQTQTRDAFRKFGIRLHRQRLIAACIGVLVMLVTVIVCCMVYQHVGVVHDFFSPSKVVIVRNAAYEDGWQKLEADGGMLEFDSIFWDREVASHSDSDGSVELRFLDEYGNICLDGIKIEPGTTVQLEGMGRNKVYEIEYRAESEFFYLTFH